MKTKILSTIDKIYLNNILNLEIICIHEDTYSRDKIQYKCKIHGVQEIKLGHLVSGHFCRHCAFIDKGINRRKYGHEYINMFKYSHNNKYIYSLDPNKKYRTKDTIKIKCLKHGYFNQTIESHKIGNGCQVCGLSFNRRFYNCKTNLYNIELINNNTKLYKIGITRFDLSFRFQNKKISEGWKMNIISILTFNDGRDAIKVENEVLKKTLDYKQDKEIKPVKHGNTEVRTINMQKYIDEALVGHNYILV